MIKKLFILSLFFFTKEIVSQELLTPSFSFSHKKTSYITLADGTELNGTIKDIDRDKGLIEFIKIKDGAGKKHKLKPEDIKFMYLPPSGLDKLSKRAGFLTNVQKWNNEKLNQDLISQGFIYFELADVKIKKKNKKLLMQLLNPDFSKVIKVYHDPYAKKTMSLGVGSLNVVGGNSKSYYIAKNDNPAYRLKRKDYKKEFIPLWNKCNKLITEFPEQKWADLVKHVLAYSKCEN